MNSFKIKINFKDNGFIICDDVIKFMIAYNITLDCDVLNVFYVNGRDSFILTDIYSIEFVK